MAFSAPDQRKALSILLGLSIVLGGTMRGVIENTAWEEITDLTRVVRPIGVMFWPYQVTSFPAALSTRYWKSTTFNCHTESGRPKYFTGKEAWAAGILVRMCSRSR